jgi:hypothetical protein
MDILLADALVAKPIAIDLVEQYGQCDELMTIVAESIS